MNEPFHNPTPLTYNESKKQREIFDRLATRIKARAADRGNPMTDQEAIEATRNWLGYAQLAADVAERQYYENKREEAAKESL